MKPATNGADGTGSAAPSRARRRPPPPPPPTKRNGQLKRSAVQIPRDQAELLNRDAVWFENLRKVNVAPQIVPFGVIRALQKVAKQPASGVSSSPEAANPQPDASANAAALSGPRGDHTDEAPAPAAATTPTRPAASPPTNGTRPSAKKSPSPPAAAQSPEPASVKRPVHQPTQSPTTEAKIAANPSPRLANSQTSGSMGDVKQLSPATQIERPRYSPSWPSELQSSDNEEVEETPVRPRDAQSRERTPRGPPAQPARLSRSPAEEELEFEVPRGLGEVPKAVRRESQARPRHSQSVLPDLRRQNVQPSRGGPPETETRDEVGSYADSSLEQLAQLAQAQAQALMQPQTRALARSRAQAQAQQAQAQQRRRLMKEPIFPELRERRDVVAQSNAAEMLHANAFRTNLHNTAARFDNRAAVTSPDSSRSSMPISGDPGGGVVSDADKMDVVMHEREKEEEQEREEEQEEEQEREREREEEQEKNDNAGAEATNARGKKDTTPFRSPSSNLPPSQTGGTPVQRQRTPTPPPPLPPVHTWQPPYETFTSAYPAYRGDLEDFLRACYCLEGFAKAGSLASFLFDDVIRGYVDFIEYVQDDTSGTPQTLLEWYHRHVETLECNKKVVTRDNITAILGAYPAKVASIRQLAHDISSSSSSGGENGDGVRGGTGDGLARDGASIGHQSNHGGGGDDNASSLSPSLLRLVGLTGGSSSTDSSSWLHAQPSSPQANSIFVTQFGDPDNIHPSRPGFGASQDEDSRGDSGKSSREEAQEGDRGPRPSKRFGGMLSSSVESTDSPLHLPSSLIPTCALPPGMDRVRYLLQSPAQVSPSQPSQLLPRLLPPPSSSSPHAQSPEKGGRSDSSQLQHQQQQQQQQKLQQQPQQQSSGTSGDSMLHWPIDDVVMSVAPEADSTHHRKRSREEEEDVLMSTARTPKRQAPVATGARASSIVVGEDKGQSAVVRREQQEEAHEREQEPAPAEGRGTEQQLVNAGDKGDLDDVNINHDDDDDDDDAFESTVLSVQSAREARRPPVRPGTSDDERRRVTIAAPGVREDARTPHKVLPATAKLAAAAGKPKAKLKQQQQQQHRRQRQQRVSAAKGDPFAAFLRRKQEELKGKKPAMAKGTSASVSASSSRPSK